MEIQGIVPGVGRAPLATAEGRGGLFVLCPDVILFLPALRDLSFSISCTLLVKKLQEHGKKQAASV